MNEKLVDYFRKGMERGYSIEHIQNVLVQHGHNPLDVRLVAQYLRQEMEPQRPQQPPRRRFPVLAAVVGLLVFAGLTAALVAVLGPSGPTGAVIDNPEEKASRLNEISRMDDEIDASQQHIDELSRQLQQKELTIEQKNEIIDQQIQEIEKIQGRIDEQRQTIRDFLLELLNEMMRQPKE